MTRSEIIQHGTSKPNFIATSFLRGYKSAKNLISTLANGQPSDNPGSVQQVRYGNTNGGLIVLSDTQTIEILAHFARERIPER